MSQKHHDLSTSLSDVKHKLLKNKNNNLKLNLLELLSIKITKVYIAITKDIKQSYCTGFPSIECTRNEMHIAYTARQSLYTT